MNNMVFIHEVMNIGILQVNIKFYNTFLDFFSEMKNGIAIKKF